MDDNALFQQLGDVSLAWYSEARRNEQGLVDLAELLSVSPEQLRRVIYKPRFEQPTEAVLLSDAIDLLATATKAEGRSPRTVGDYRQKLGVLLTYLGDRPADQVTDSDLRRFVADLRARERRYVDSHSSRPEIPGGLSAASVAGYVRCFNRLFAFLAKEKLIEADRVPKLKAPRLKRGEPKACHFSDFPKLLQATAGDDPISLRNRALLIFMADTGCRVGGTVRLQLSDLDFDQKLASVTEKGGKTRRVSFSEPTASALSAWLAVRPACKGDWLWSSLGPRGSSHLTEEGVRQVFRRLKERSGAKGPCNPHAFRHGLAKSWIQSSGDMASLARQLGHESIETTDRYYLIFSTAELAEKHDRHSPIAEMGRKGEL